MQKPSLRMNKLLFVALIGIVLFLGCKKDNVTYEPTPYALKIPSHFPQMPIPEDNPMTVEGVALGKMLFYEKALSLDNSISCAACHSPSSAFSDMNQFSTGVNGTLGNRNSMALVNLGWQNSFFWDGRSKTLEDQILQPVPNPVEMHLEWTEAVSRLQGNMKYRNAFYRAFGETQITKELVAKAIAQFLRTMISGKSEFDLIYKHENGIPMTDAEQTQYAAIDPAALAGYDLFKSLNGADCFHCHNGPLMQVQKFSNNGLDATFSDNGRGIVTGNAADNGKFKVPTLRNIALSAPYMHDGRFQTLDDVINHYSTGIHQSPTIDPLIEYAFQGGVQLDQTQKNQLKAFLLTLTDYEFVTNPEFLP